MNSGIYKIANIINDNFYIGSTVNLAERKLKHKKTLNSGNHHNRHLQRAYNKYGADNFIFEVIEYIDNKEDLIVREQYYIDNLNPIYNICKKAGSSLGVKRTKDFKLRLSKIKKNNQYSLGHKHSLEAKFKMSESKRGKNQSEETILKKSISFKLLSPQNEMVEGVNLRKFCREHKLDQSAMWRVLNNKYKQHKGWTKG